MHDLKRLFAVPHLACLESVERACIVIHKKLFSLTIENLEASPRLTQKGKPLSQLLRSLDPYGGLEQIACLENVLKALAGRMTIAVTKPVKV